MKGTEVDYSVCACVEEGGEENGEEAADDKRSSNVHAGFHGNRGGVGKGGAMESPSRR